MSDMSNHKRANRASSEGMKKNETSKKEEKDVTKAVRTVIERLTNEFNIVFEHEKRLYLKEIVDLLKNKFPDVRFADPTSKRPFITPDAGITYMKAVDGGRFPILIGEVKNQGTNDLRAKEGKPKQSKGNAVERLGKNVIGLRIYMDMIDKGIFPFVCFGDGCDFAPGSSILDRVLTIAMFGELMCDHTDTEADFFNRGSFYFREKRWTKEEMEEIMYMVAKHSIDHYFEKYGKAHFVNVSA